MRRRPAVGVVICNRWSIRFSHLSFMTPYPSTDGPRQTQPDTLTLTFRVTTAYITHTCSTVQPPHAHAPRTYLSSFFLSFLRSRSAYLSITPESFFTLSLLIPASLVSTTCSLLIVITCFVSSPNRFVFGPVTILSCFFCKGTSSVHPSSCRHQFGLLRPKKLKVGGRSNPSVCFENRVFSSFFFLSCARGVAKVSRFEITFLSFCFPFIASSRHVATICDGAFLSPIWHSIRPAIHRGGLGLEGVNGLVSLSSHSLSLRSTFFRFQKFKDLENPIRVVQITNWLKVEGG